MVREVVILVPRWSIKWGFTQKYLCLSCVNHDRSLRGTNYLELSLQSLVMYHRNRQKNNTSRFNWWRHHRLFFPPPSRALILLPRLKFPPECSLRGELKDSSRVMFSTTLCSSAISGLLVFTFFFLRNSFVIELLFFLCEEERPLPTNAALPALRSGVGSLLLAPLAPMFRLRARRIFPKETKKYAFSLSSLRV